MRPAPTSSKQQQAAAIASPPRCTPWEYGELGTGNWELSWELSWERVSTRHCTELHCTFSTVVPGGSRLPQRNKQDLQLNRSNHSNTDEKSRKSFGHGAEHSPRPSRARPGLLGLARPAPSLHFTSLHCSGLHWPAAFPREMWRIMHVIQYPWPLITVHDLSLVYVPGIGERAHRTATPRPSRPPLTPPDLPGL